MAPLKWHAAQRAMEREYWSNLYVLCRGKATCMALAAGVARTDVYKHLEHSEPLLKSIYHPMPSRWCTVRNALKRDYWTKLYAICDGKVYRMALIAGTTRTQVYVYLQRLGLRTKGTNPAHRGNWGNL